MGRDPKFTKEGLEAEVERYFMSISRIVPVTEEVPTGKRDEKGHMIFEQKPVINALGEPAQRLEYITPPTVGGLCAFLGIHRSTWSAWADVKKYSDTVARAGGRMRAWNEEQLLLRSGRDVKGIIFNLENNYGYRERQDVSVSGETVEEYLQKLSQSGGGPEF